MQKLPKTLKRKLLYYKSILISELCQASEALVQAKRK